MQARSAGVHLCRRVRPSGRVYRRRGPDHRRHHAKDRHLEGGSTVVRISTVAEGAGTRGEAEPFTPSAGVGRARGNDGGWRGVRPGGAAGPKPPRLQSARAILYRIGASVRAVLRLTARTVVLSESPPGISSSWPADRARGGPGGSYAGEMRQKVGLGGTPLCVRKPPVDHRVLHDGLVLERPVDGVAGKVLLDIRARYRVGDSKRLEVHGEAAKRLLERYAR